MNPYLSKGFAPVHREAELAALAIEGAWPADLRGTLYRIGPNPRFTPIEPYNPLLGDGMAHAFHIDGGRVSYRNRWVRTEQWQLEDEAGRALFSTTGDPRRHDPSVAGLRTNGVANTNVVRHGGRLLALEEGHAPIELDPLTLDTRAVWDFEGRLRNNMTAHPRIDPRSGEMIFFANEPARRFDGELVWYVANAQSEIVLKRSIRAPFPSVVHDFAVTRDFVVFLVCPVTISLSRAAAGGPALAWEPDRKVHVGVTRRDGTGSVRWLRGSAAFVWHVANAWNDGGHVVVDLCEQRAPAFPMPDGTMTDQRDWRQRYTRWELDLDHDGEIRSVPMSEVVCEYPRIDERYATRETRHVFFACHGGPGTDDPFHRGIAHFDGERGRMRTCSLAPGSAVSEPVFVPRSERAPEGDGWLLCLVYDETTDRSHIAVFDTRDVERGPVAGAMLPWRVPMGFHGTWVPEPDAARA